MPAKHHNYTLAALFCGFLTVFVAVLQGTAEVGGKISYVPQNPWCQNLTLRDNIVFGTPFEEDRYSRVSKICD